MWLAYDVAVMPGVSIGAGSIVAARAVVTRSLPAGVLAAGLPTQVKRHLAGGSQTDRRGLVGALLDAWGEALRCKGLAVREVAENCWEVDGGAEQWQVVWRPSTAGAGEVEIRGFANDGAGIRFHFDTRRINGALDRLGHDLRDFCRRRSWSFPYARNSTPIVPARFARLMD